MLQVRGLPCAHNFHVECIDEWLRLNVKCPRCRCSVFPNLDLSALSNLLADSERSPATPTTNRYVRTVPFSQIYLLRMQGLLWPVRTEIAGVPTDADIDVEAAENGSVHMATEEPRGVEPVSSAGCVLVGQSTQPHH
jgi:E3 ubiquitin-protein ligase SIS3